MTDSTTPRTTPRHRNGWLILIAVFKLAQAALFAGIAIGAFRLLGHDVGGLLARLADHLRFNPESRFVNFVLDRAEMIDDHLLRRIGAAGFIYATLDLVEGTGLYFEKIWAEYLTLFITGSFLPLEILEVARRLTTLRISLLTLNLLVFVYLFWLVLTRRQQRKAMVS